MKSYIVIGLGRFGQTLARQLCALGAEVLAIDKRADLVQQVADDVTHAVVGDGQDKEVLRALGTRNFDCPIIAIDHTAGNGKFNRTAFSGKRNGRYSQLFIAKNRRTLELLSRILIDNCCAVCSHHHRLDITPV